MNYAVLDAQSSEFHEAYRGVGYNSPDDSKSEASGIPFCVYAGGGDSAYIALLLVGCDEPSRTAKQTRMVTTTDVPAPSNVCRNYESRLLPATQHT